MALKIDLTGQTFGRLTVVEAYHERTKIGAMRWKCLCICGNSTISSASNLKQGGSTSCGCSLNRGKKSGTAEYYTWRSMIKRCTLPDYHGYHRYGGRGITVCDRWLESLDNFIEDMGIRPTGMSLDRVDNNSGYCKENCRWASMSEQARNRSNTTLYERHGITLCFKDWCDRYEICSATVIGRLKRGWDLDRALMAPADVKHRLLNDNNKKDTSND